MSDRHSGSLQGARFMAAKPRKPSPREIDALTRRADGRWCKKYQGRMFYFRGTKKEAVAEWKAKLAELTTAENRLVSKRRLSDIYPSPENDDIYGPVDPDDPGIVALAADIRARKLLEPIVITLDDCIISGHRRHAACLLAGLEEVDCRVEPIRRSDDIDAFVRLLVAHNEQRVKTFAHKIREEAAKLGEDRAYDRVMRLRAERSTLSIPSLYLGERKSRSKISDAKRPMLEACLAILRRFHRPLSDRKIHYELLNDPPLRHASKPHSRYRNNRRCYNDLTNLLTRARHEGIIDWDAICDETRPVTTWNTWPDPQMFIAEHMRKFLIGYFRDILQSQPNHLEVLAEKNTVAAELRGVCSRYTIPMTSGRGFCSSKPKHDLYERYRKSGKQKLIILIVSDLDPAGMTIAESFARSMRDDFDIKEVHAIKVAITEEHVRSYKIPHGEKAKKGKGAKDALRAEFVRRYGEYVYEVEALPDGELTNLLDSAVRSVLDLEAYNHEVDALRKDCLEVEAARVAARKALKGIASEIGEDEIDEYEDEDYEEDEES